MDALVRLPPLSPGDAVFYHTGKRMEDCPCMQPNLVGASRQATRVAVPEHCCDAITPSNAAIIFVHNSVSSHT